MQKPLPLLFLIILIISYGCRQFSEPEKPNILWITAEDITTMLGSYGDPNARTPNLDAFTEKSIKFTNAYATAPVCMPSRSAIITGVHATSLGTQHLRSDVDIPDFIPRFPKLLRGAGYFVTNNDKEDYGFTDTTIWHHSSKKAHWRLRENEDQPFFSVFNLGITHQSGIFGNDSVYNERISEYTDKIDPIDPENIIMPPYFPDSPEIRKLMARYYTNVGIMDFQFQQILNQLNEDGLTENTIVFFYADHGTGLPRAKRALYDSGLKVPLIVHVPEKYASALNMFSGTENHNMVSFIDFAPTVLELAGIEKPDEMQGRIFISTLDFDENAFVYGASDRVDEAYEMARTIRTPKYRYVRNYLPFTALLQPNYYTDQSAIMQELEKFRNNPGLTPEQQTLFRPERTPEELYDVENDPFETNNIAGNPEYEEVMQEMRLKLRQEVLRTYDTGFMPEPEMNRLSDNSTPYELARNDEVFPLPEILAASDLMLEKKPGTKSILKLLNHSNGFVRYWAVVSAQSLKLFEPEIVARLEELLNDDFKTVQIEAAKTLIKAGDDDAVAVILNYMQGENDQLLLYAARAFELTWQLLPEIPEEFYQVYEKLKKQTEGKWQGHDLYAFWSMSQVLKNENVKPPEEVNYAN
ncbi:MAG: sulfatase-like hydrolase/transferase [Prolixibacteraceae bacterium]